MQKLVWIPVLASVLSLGVAGCGVNGSGVAKEETRQVAAFDRVDIGGVATLELTVGGAPSLSVRGDDNIVPLIETTVVGGVLHITQQKDVKPHVELVVRATAPSLASVDASGATHVVVKGAGGGTLALDASGASHLDVAGTAAALQVKASGAAHVDASAVDGGDVTVDASGAANVTVHAKGALRVDASGAASVSYAGEPTSIVQDVSAAASLKKQ